ncbi:MAG: 4Fe-4S binding protein [Eubacteriales bacterium]|nr:4Fe-4S binding protein [Eubacteriales bacterium]
MAKWTILAEGCKGCGLCVEACPKKILCLDSGTINHKGHTPARMMDESRCTGCGFCATMCPDCVITISR